MRWLADTNILLRSAQPNHPHYPSAISAVAALLANGDEVSVLPQNLYEFWAVATRPIERNGLGLTTIEAEAEIGRIESLLNLLQDVPDLYNQWRMLVVEHSVSGLPSHDARLVAGMLVFRITHLLTFNTADFARYQGVIKVVNPRDVPAA